MDGKIHRVDVDGDKAGRKSGAYIGHLDGFPAGYIHNHKTGEAVRWKATRPTRSISPAERGKAADRIKRKQDAKVTARRQQEGAVARKASIIWSRAKPVRTHPYLVRKDVGSHGLREDRRGNLVVPMQDIAGKIWSLQTIDRDGGKLYLKGGRKAGTHAVLGRIDPGAPIVIAEGYAAAATMREVAGLATVAAFDSGNLLEVANAYRAADPKRAIIMAGDNDHHLPRREAPLPNVGAEKATAAAAAVEGMVVLPPFVPADQGSDFNDYAAQHGATALRRLVEAELGQRSITPPRPIRISVARPAASQEARDTFRAQAATSADQAAGTASRVAQQAVQRSRGPSM
ncbi:MAG: toprim domain-containing protein [Janthinobacterium lividum]